MKLLTKKDQQIVVDSKPSDDKSAHDFVRELIRKGIVEINPYLDKSGIRYPEAEEHFKNYSYPMMVSAFEALVHQGVLKDKEVTRTLICPSCSSPEVHSKFTCPRCGSQDVGLTQLLEHKECGYIGARKDFMKDETMVCPRCGTVLTEEGTDYRSIGNFYQCEKCSNRFDRPEVIHWCLNCGKVSTFQDAKYIKVSSYRVNDEVLSELTSEFPLLENLSVFLENKGFNVKLHDTITGVSGTQSHFDLVAEKGDIRIVMDASIDGNKSDVVAFLAKKIDVNPTKALLLDLSGGNELAVLGKIYGIDVFGIGVIDAKVEQGVPKEFEALIDKIVKDSNIKQSDK
jgi:predicted RNA-binding Zn-ribbon protein involved in translation (DUF1610 family)